MKSEENPQTFKVDVQSQMSPAPLVKIVLDDKGIEIEKIKFVTLWSKTRTENYYWNEIKRLVLRKYPKINFFVANHPTSPFDILDVYAGNKVLHLNSSLVSNFHELISQIAKKSNNNIQKIQYTRFINDHPWILISAEIIVALITIFIEGATISRKAAVISFSIIFGMLIASFISYKKHERS